MDLILTLACAYVEAEEEEKETAALIASCLFFLSFLFFSVTFLDPTRICNCMMVPVKEPGTRTGTRKKTTGCKFGEQEEQERDSRCERDEEAERTAGRLAVARGEDGGRPAATAAAVVVTRRKSGQDRGRDSIAAPAVQ